ARLVGQRRHVERPAEAAELAVSEGEDRHPAVGRLEHATRCAAGLHDAALEMAGHQADRLQCRRRLHQARIDVAAARLVAAGIEGGGQALEGVERGRHVDHDHRHAMRDAVLALVLAHQPCVGLQHRVHRRPLAERAGLAEAGDGHIEEARLARRHLLVVETQPLDHARPEAFEEHVGALEQPPHDVLAGLALEIDGDAALAEIADDRVGRVAAVAHPEGARPVAVADALDLDHVGAMLGEQHGAIGPGDALAEVDDLQSGEGRVVAHYILTSSLPKFSPRSRPMKARGALSMPCTTSSRYLSCPLLIHSPIWRIAASYLPAKSVTMKPCARTRLPTKVPSRRGPIGGVVALYCEIEPHRATRPKKLMLRSTA